MTEDSVNGADFAIIKNANATSSFLNYEQLKIGGTIYDSQGSPALGAVNTRNRAVALSRVNELSGVQTHWVDFNASSAEKFAAFMDKLPQCIDFVTLNSVSSVKECLS